MRRLAVVALALLAGCAAPAKPDQTGLTVALVQACSAFGAARDTLTPLKVAGKLTLEQIAQVDKLRSVVNPVCLNPVPPADLVEAITRVNGSILDVLLIQEDAAKKGA